MLSIINYEFWARILSTQFPQMQNGYPPNLKNRNQGLFSEGGGHNPKDVREVLGVESGDCISFIAEDGICTGINLPAYICQDTLQWLPSIVSVWRYRFVIRAQSGKTQNTYNLRRFLLMPLSGGLKP